MNKEDDSAVCWREWSVTVFLFNYLQQLGNWKWGAIDNTACHPIGIYEITLDKFVAESAGDT